MSVFPFRSQNTCAFLSLSDVYFISTWFQDLSVTNKVKCFTGLYKRSHPWAPHSQLDIDVCNYFNICLDYHNGSIVWKKKHRWPQQKQRFSNFYCEITLWFSMLIFIPLESGFNSHIPANTFVYHRERRKEPTTHKKFQIFNKFIRCSTLSDSLINFILIPSKRSLIRAQLYQFLVYNSALVAFDNFRSSLSRLSQFIFPFFS